MSNASNVNHGRTVTSQLNPLRILSKVEPPFEQTILGLRFAFSKNQLWMSPKFVTINTLNWHTSYRNDGHLVLRVPRSMCLTEIEMDLSTIIGKKHFTEGDLQARLASHRHRVNHINRSTPVIGRRAHEQP